MAKQVSEILVKLGIQGAEGLDKLKSSFRELEKAIGPSAATIERARESIIAFGEEGKNTEQLIKGQIDALRGLQSQTERGSAAWAELAGDIERFRQASRKTDTEIEILRQGILSVVSGTSQSQKSLREYISDLSRLRSEATITGGTFQELSRDIAALTGKLQEAERQTQQTSRVFGSVLGQALASTSAGARRQLDSLKELINEQRGIVDSINLLSKKERELTHNQEKRADAQERLNRALTQQRQLTYQESIRTSRESVRAGAAAFADPIFLRTITPEALDRRLGELPNTTAGLNQGLSELSERLVNTKRNTIDYLVVAMQMAGAQRELTAVTQGYAQALLMGIRTGAVAPSARNLQEVITALRTEMSQLDTTTTEGARAYAENASQARVLENQLKELAGAYRHVGDMATQAATAQTSEATARITANYMNRGMVRAQEQALADLGQRVRAGVAATPLALPAAGQTSAPGTGLPISGEYVQPGRPSGRVQRVLTPGTFPGERQQGPEIPFDISDRARRAAISEGDAVRAATEAREQAERQIESYRAEIDKARRADIGSIESTERLRGAINQYRSTLPGASAEFRKLTRELGDLDIRSEKLSRNLGRRRMSGMQVAQAAGAALSGGIFGGPEGFLGGAIGTAVGGVGGAFAGAAIGAQIGGLRQQLGGFADYAAQIQKMEIALKNASGGGQEFSRAMAAAENATRNLNVPQDVAIQGMTKLTAAVKGAGGQVSDAELVFRNVSSAIKATGGSSEDVDGAITAMVQVFSKGKVSAEELSGQLGERLPGAVTKFAKANEMSLPGLQKALEQGQVGLNELMNFIVQLGDEYAGVAEGIAASSQDSGARLTIAFNQMKIAVGEALQPIGAEFQAVFAEFIEKITPTLVEVLPKIGEIALGVARNLDTLAIAAAAAFGVFAVGKIAAVGGLGAALLKVAAAAGTASVSLQALNAAALLNPWTALASGIAAVGVALYNTHKEKQRLNEVLSDGSISQLENEIKRLESEIAKAEAKTRGYGNEVRGMGQDLGIANVKLVQTKQLLESFKSEYRIRVFVDQVFRGAQGTPQGYKTINGRLAYQVPGQGWVDAETSKPISGGEPSKFPSLTDGGRGGAKGKKERESQVPQLLAELAVQEQIARINARARQAVLDNNELLNIRLEGEKRLAEIAGQIRRIDFEKIPAEEAELKRKLLLLAADEARAEVIQRLALASKQFLEGTTQPLDELGKKYQEQIDDRIRLKELISEGITESLALEYIAIEKLLDIENEKFEIRVGQLEAEIASGELGKEALARAERELEILKERLKLQGKRGEDAKRKAAEAQPEQKGKLQQFIEEGEASLKDLEGLAVRVSQGIGDAIGSSISNGISGLIEGTTTVKDIFANFLKDVGQILVQEAAKMIATYVAIGIARIFAGFAAGKSSGPNPNPGGIPSTGNAGAPTINGFDTGSISNLAANGAYFANGKANFSSSSPQPFANGGIVNRPTFFRFKDGGAMGGGSSIPFQMGVMGEAGPEAIMPLSRGSDGRLGVTANIPFTKSASRLAAESSESETIASLANPKPIDVRFESQVINNVEYVTAEEYRKGMAQAAERGRSLTLATLQNSVKTRKRVGIG